MHFKNYSFSFTTMHNNCEKYKGTSVKEVGKIIDNMKSMLWKISQPQYKAAQTKTCKNGSMVL